MKSHSVKFKSKRRVNSEIESAFVSIFFELDYVLPDGVCVFYITCIEFEVLTDLTIRQAI